MLLLLVLSTAAIFCPALSQPARSDVFEEGDYPFPFYRGRVDWGEAVDRPHKAMGISTGNGIFQMKVQSGNMLKDKNMQELTKDKLFEKDMVPVRLARRQFVIDPIGGGYLLRRESGPEVVSKKSFPLDPIGGGYLLKRNAQDKQYDFLEPFNQKNELSKRSRADFSVRLIPKEDILSTSATGDSYINSKDLHMLGAGLESFPIDPIGGGLLLGRSIDYDKTRTNDKQNYFKYSQQPSGNYLGH